MKIGAQGAVMSFVIAIAPLLVAMAAGAVGALFGCNINEGGTDPCVVLGVPLGGTLASIGIMGWFGVITLPLGLLALVLFSVLAFIGVVYALIKKEPLRSALTRLDWFLFVVTVIAAIALVSWLWLL
jgi:hypothetical protein